MSDAPEISVAAEMALQRGDDEWLDRHVAGLREKGLDEMANEIERRRPVKRAILKVGSFHVEVRAYEREDEDDASFVELFGVDCSLEGTQPGQYTPIPLDEADRLGPDVDVDFIGAGDEVVVLGPEPFVGVLRDVEGPEGSETAQVQPRYGDGDWVAVHFGRVAHTDSKAARFAALASGELPPCMGCGAPDDHDGACQR